MEESLVILRVMDTHRHSLFLTLASLLSFSPFFYEQLVFASNKNSSKSHLARILRDDYVRGVSEASVTTVLIDRWRNAKRDYRDNTPEHNATKCPVEGNKIGRMPDKCIVREGRGWNSRLCAREGLVRPFANKGSLQAYTLMTFHIDDCVSVPAYLNFPRP